MSLLVDTNVISELVRPRPDPGVLAWADSIRRVAVSVITLEELAYGLAWRPNRRVQDWLEGFVERSCEVLPVTEAIARRAGRLRGALRAEGRTRTQADMLVAATAAVHELTLVTRNERDFEGCAIPILNPFGPGGSSPGE